MCKRDLRQKYIIDDPLKAKCNAALRIEVSTAAAARPRNSPGHG
jgi:hypothetical protein